MSFRFALFLCLWNLPRVCFAQPGVPAADSAILLPVAEVLGKPLRARATGGREEAWNTAELEPFSSSNLGELLGQQSGLFIKSYGLGSLATSSARGGSAGHTSILWNGLPLHSPMLGLLDFSLLPLAFTDQVELQYGGNTAAWGSGAIGAVVGLNNQPDFGQPASLSFRSTMGSFGLWDQQAKARYGRGDWRAVTRFFHRQTDNDFPYRTAAGQPVKRQTNAALQQTGFQQELYWRPAAGQQLALFAWAQQSDREIPPTTVQNVSEASQADRFLRTALHWKSVRKNIVWQARAGLFREQLDYRDEQVRLRSLSRFWTASAEAEGEWALSTRQSLLFGLSHSWMQAEADAYESPPQQNRTAPFVSFRQAIGSWQTQASLRLELVDGQWTPLAPALGLEGELTPWLSAGARLSRNYRLPTFNDLYWQPGGNPGLLPESGWSQEASLRAHGAPGRHAWSYSLAGFSRRINNWILWSIRDGQSFWSANNITEVWSRGLEQRLAWELTGQKWRLKLSGGYDFILSTNEVTVENPRMPAGEQLFYVPEHQAFGKIGFHWKALMAEYRHQYTGPVSTLNAGILAGYQLGFLSLSCSFQFPKWGGQAFLNLNNLWDANYRAIERRPMPGRHFQAGIQIDFRNKQ